MGYVNMRRIPLSGQVYSVAQQEKLEKALARNRLEKKEVKEAYMQGVKVKQLKFSLKKNGVSPTRRELAEAGLGAKRGAITTRQYKAAKLIDKRALRGINYRKTKMSV